MAEGFLRCWGSADVLDDKAGGHLEDGWIGFSASEID